MAADGALYRRASPPLCLMASVTRGGLARPIDLGRVFGSGVVVVTTAEGIVPTSPFSRLTR
jgi:hypothetical protein